MSGSHLRTQRILSSHFHHLDALSFSEQSREWIFAFLRSRTWPAGLAASQVNNNHRHIVNSVPPDCSGCERVCHLLRTSPLLELVLSKGDHLVAFHDIPASNA